MTSAYYSHDDSFPANNTIASASAMRAEFELIEAGFDKLPTLTGNGGKIVAVNAGGTALEALTTTGTGNVVRATAPTFTGQVTINRATDPIALLVQNGSLSATWAYVGGGGDDYSAMMGIDATGVATFASFKRRAMKFGNYNSGGTFVPNLTFDSLGDATFARAVAATNGFSGSLTGNVTGDVTGNLTGNVTGALTGNAATATKLFTARAINGVDFDGSAAITVTAAAGTLSGSTLAAGVTASSLTSLGTLSSVTVSGTSSLAAINASGDFAIATNKFTVASASGNTVIAGTLGVTGETTTGLIHINTNAAGALRVGTGAGSTYAVDTSGSNGGFRYTDGTITAIIGTANSRAFFGTQSNHAVDVFVNGGAYGFFNTSGWNGAVVGNASTATTLATSRTIWGQSFNGSANVSGALTGVTDITASGGVSAATGAFSGMVASNGWNATYTSPVGALTASKMLLQMENASTARSYVTGVDGSTRGVWEHYSAFATASPALVFSASASAFAITPNTTIAGTLGVTGATTLAAVSATTGAFSGAVTVVKANATAPHVSARYNASNTQIGFNVANSNGYGYLAYNANPKSGSDTATYDITNYAGKLRLDGGMFQVDVAASGSAGADISWSTLVSATTSTFAITPAVTMASTLTGGDNVTINKGSSTVGVYVGPAGAEASFVYDIGGNLKIAPRSGFTTQITAGGLAVTGTLSATTTSGTTLTLTGLGAATTNTTYLQDLIVTGGAAKYGTIRMTDNATYSAFINWNNAKLELIGPGASSGAIFDPSGNLGLGVTPSAWTRPAIQLGAAGTVGYFAATSGVNVSSNMFYDGANKYIGDGYATLYGQASGAHLWYTAPSGTAGSAITFTQAMSLSSTGLNVAGTITSGGQLKVNTNTVYFEKPGTRSWTLGVNQTSGAFALESGDGLGTANYTASAHVFSGTLTATDTISSVNAAGTNKYIALSTTGVQNTVMGFNNSGSTDAQGTPNNHSYFGNLNGYPLSFTSNGALLGTWASTEILIKNTTGAPGSNPSGGGYLYVESGALKYRGSSGTVTTIANA